MAVVIVSVWFGSSLIILIFGGSFCGVCKSSGVTIRLGGFSLSYQCNHQHHQ